MLATEPSWPAEVDGTHFALMEITVSMLAAVVGAVVFTLLNAKLEEWTTSRSPLPHHDLDVPPRARRGRNRAGSLATRGK